MISSERRKKPGRVLIAEGDPATREFFTSALENRGYTIDVATDGLETIGRLEALPYKAVILDLHLPRVDGLGVLEFIADRHPELLPSVILVTGLALSEIASLYPICATLPKSLSIARLAEVVDACVSRTE